LEATHVGTRPLMTDIRLPVIGTPAIVLDDLLRRVQAEFIEMPGLRLTRAQARRLWALDDALCDAILTTLVDSRFLARSGDAAFVRAE
jgi:hypothetical protein